MFLALHFIRSQQPIKGDTTKGVNRRTRAAWIGNCHPPSNTKGVFTNRSSNRFDFANFHDIPSNSFHDLSSA